MAGFKDWDMMRAWILQMRHGAGLVFREPSMETVREEWATTSAVIFFSSEINTSFETRDRNERQHDGKVTFL
jgi:hypothetical protein